LITGLLHRCNYIEKAGTGIQRMRDGMKEAGLPEPTFEFSEFFTVIFHRHNISKDIKQEFELNEKPTERIVTILRHLAVHQSLDVEGISAELSTTGRTIRNDLKLLIQMGWVQSLGSTKGREYELSSRTLVLVFR
jgi:ATP-dependent DNA helicase RecG